MMYGPLSPDEIKRYQRQMLLPNIGIDGQERLKQAKVLCIGAGGLGSPVLLYLAAAGVGTLGIIDMDEVDITNLQRQIIFSELDLGVKKVLAAEKNLKNLNSNLNTITYDEAFCAANADKILPHYDLIIDATDNFAAKYLINDSCVKYGRPYIYGSILGFEGRVTVLSAQHGPCYRCLYPQPPTGYIPNCAEFGIIGALPGIIGCIQAMEAIKWILSEGGTLPSQIYPNRPAFYPLLGRLWMLDTQTMSTQYFTIKKNPDCPTCSKTGEDIRLEEPKMQCATNNSSLVPNITLEESKNYLKDANAQFLDVRELNEWHNGFIPNARHFPLSKLLTGEGVNELNPDKKYIVYCQSGKRSQIAAAYLMQSGITDVVNLENGFSCWDGDISF